MPLRHSPRFLCLWLPNWPIQRRRIASPALGGRALVLSEENARHEVVAACSAEAAQLGVSPGMRTPEAQSLLGGHHLQILPHLPGDDRRSLTKLAVECELFSPSVSLEESSQPDALLMDVTGLAPLWGEEGERGLGEAVLRWSREHHFEARVAISSSIALSLAAARYLADEAAPLVLPTDRCESAAAQLPVHALRLEADTLATLALLGIRQIGQLLELPRQSLPSRLGEGVLQRLDQLVGGRQEVPAPVRGEAPLRARWRFESPVASDEILSRVRGKLLERICSRMQQRQCGALRMLIAYTLDVPDADPLSTVVRLCRPSRSVRQLAELADLQMEQVRLSSAVTAVSLFVGCTAPMTSRQLSLFDGQSQHDEYQLTLLISRLSSQLGCERVSRVTKLRSVDPARVFAAAPATDLAPRQYLLSPTEAKRYRRVPLQVSPPRLTTVLFNKQGEPAHLPGPPALRVVRSWGPERIETGWWRERALARDAYWIELENGARLWLLRELRQGRCWVAGGL